MTTPIYADILHIPISIHFSYQMISFRSSFTILKRNKITKTITQSKEQNQFYVFNFYFISYNCVYDTLKLIIYSAEYKFLRILETFRGFYFGKRFYFTNKMRCCTKNPLVKLECERKPVTVKKNNLFNSSKNGFY